VYSTVENARRAIERDYRRLDHAPGLAWSDEPGYLRRVPIYEEAVVMAIGNREQEKDYRENMPIFWVEEVEIDRM
jgi:hypothetical protein